MENKCLICTRIFQIKELKNPYFVRELTTGYVVIGDFQFYKGYTLFLSKTHVDELHKLGSTRSIFLNEMAIVAEAVFNAFKPSKLNYELLGNTDRHLHWHIIPRYDADPRPNAPIWVIDKSIRYAESTRPSGEELKKLITQLNQELGV
jgi:diadenosine tetraphosphate (Ap4A) HIT family hydrolase